MRIPIILTILTIFFFAIFLPVISTFAIRLIPSGIQPSLENTQKIYQDLTLSQSFVSLKDNLAGIGVSIKNPNFANKKDVTFNIYDKDNNLIRSVILNGKN